MEAVEKEQAAAKEEAEKEKAEIEKERKDFTARRFEGWRGGNLAKSASGAHVSKKRIETITFVVTFFYFLTK